MKIFSEIKGSLVVNDSRFLILRKNQIDLRSIYENTGVNVTHAGHLGLTKIKAQRRSEVFLLNKDKIITQVLGLSHDRHKLLYQPTPLATLGTINLIFLGSLTNIQYIFIMIDQRITYPTAEFMRSTSGKNVIFAIERFFSSHGIPNKIISDNDPPSTCSKLLEYFASKDLKHNRKRSLWFQEKKDSQVERFKQSLNKVSQTAFPGKKHWKYIFSFSNLLHPITKVSPSDLMFNQKVQFSIPHIEKKVNIDNINILEKNIIVPKLNVKEYHDNLYHVKNISLQVGDYD